MKVLDLMVDFIKMSKVWSLCMEFYGAWQSMVSLKMSILHIWVTWASKITLKNLQLYSIKLREATLPMMSHAAALFYYRNLRLHKCRTRNYVSTSAENMARPAGPVPAPMCSYNLGNEPAAIGNTAMVCFASTGYSLASGESLAT